MAGFSTDSPKLNLRSTCSSQCASSPLWCASLNRVSKKVAANLPADVLTRWRENCSTSKSISPKMTLSSWDWPRNRKMKSLWLRRASRCGTTTRPCLRRTSSSACCQCPQIALLTKFSNHSRKTSRILSSEETQTQIRSLKSDFKL